MCSLEEAYVASMVLAGAGDSIGYKSGSWEFCRKGKRIHEALAIETDDKGLKALWTHGTTWRVSDDTVMSIATAEGMLAPHKGRKSMLKNIAAKYVECMSDMGGRAPGPTTIANINCIKEDGGGWSKIKFNRSGGGCGAAMRSMCIGLRFPLELQERELVAVAVESARMSHHHPTGYLGAVAGALFTALALRGVPPVLWIGKMMAIISQVEAYVEDAGRDVPANLRAFEYFKTKWRGYIKARGLARATAATVPTFPDTYGVEERDRFYQMLSYAGWGGASGHDAPLIAYDALLGALYAPDRGSNAWEELVLRGCLHGGDSDSTGVMAGAWYGALFGFAQVYKANYQRLEYRQRLSDLGRELLAASGIASSLPERFTASAASAEGEGVKRPAPVRSNHSVQMDDATPGGGEGVVVEKEEEEETPTARPAPIPYNRSVDMG